MIRKHPIVYCPICQSEMEHTEGRWEFPPDQWLVKADGEIETAIPIDSFWCGRCAYSVVLDKQGNTMSSSKAVG